MIFLLINTEGSGHLTTEIFSISEISRTNFPVYAFAQL